jgi:hypothetical protein
MVTQLGGQHAFGQLLLELPDQAGFAQQAASLPVAWAKSWSSSSLENGPVGLRLRGFFVASVIHRSLD